MTFCRFFFVGINKIYILQKKKELSVRKSSQSESRKSSQSSESLREKLSQGRFPLMVEAALALLLCARPLLGLISVLRAVVIAAACF